VQERSIWKKGGAVAGHGRTEIVKSVECKSTNDVVDAWLEVPDVIESAIARLTDAEMDRTVKKSGMTPRETVHHLVEANIVSASMMIAALGASGAVYDWSWLWPNQDWVVRMGYAQMPVEPALATLKGLSRHLSNIIAARPDALKCEVKVFDSPGAETYPLTVEAILRQEVDHAEEHLAEFRKT
jgi:hypothetical protein